MKKILIIAPTINTQKRYFTGLAMMIGLFHRVMSRHYDCVVCSISPKLILNTNIPDFKIGSSTFLRYLDYIWLMFKSIVFIMANPKSILYMCPAPSKLGFIRDIILLKLGLFFKCKLVLHIFTGEMENFYNILSLKDKDCYLHIYNRASLIITEGNLSRRFFEKIIINPSKVVAIENALPENRVDKTTCPKTLNDEIRLLFLNNMIVSKGYWDVLKATSILVHEKKMNIKCDFVGRFMEEDNDSDQKQEFFDYIENNNLSDRIKFIPGAFGKEKRLLFEKSHFFLLPSYFPKEGKPTAIIEAMSYGCVPIVTNYRGIPEMVNSMNGIFVESRNANDIADKLEMVIHDNQKYTNLSAMCLQVFEERYTPEIYEKKMLDSLNSIL